MGPCMARRALPPPRSVDNIFQLLQCLILREFWGSVASRRAERRTSCPAARRSLSLSECTIEARSLARRELFVRFLLSRVPSCLIFQGGLYLNGLCTPSSDGIYESLLLDVALSRSLAHTRSKDITAPQGLRRVRNKIMSLMA